MVGEAVKGIIFIGVALDILGKQIDITTDILIDIIGNIVGREYV